ncbi:MAG: hypothetical protein GY841_18580 [FCB group bacterium]|nr:hypothetical protein [FCB group bacterium]
MPLTSKQLENTLVLTSASDEAIKSAKENRIPWVFLTSDDQQVKVLNAARPDVTYNGGFGFWSMKERHSEDSFASCCVYRLPADFTRPVITPDDLPAEIRTRLEEGLMYEDADDLEKQVIDYFGHVDDVLECRSDEAIGHDDWRAINAEYTSRRCDGPNPAAVYRFRKEKKYREPRDLPVEMREKLEKGLKGSEMTSIEREVMIRFRKAGLVDIQFHTEGFSPCAVSDADITNTDVRYRLRKEKTYREPDERDIDKVVEVSMFKNFPNKNQRVYIGVCKGKHYCRSSERAGEIAPWPIARVEDI